MPSMFSSYRIPKGEYDNVLSLLAVLTYTFGVFPR